MIPNIIWCEKTIPNSYSNICFELQLKQRFDYNQTLSTTNDPIEIEVDTREQSILKFENKTIKKLDVGDYHCNSGVNKDVYIERKSLVDALGTFSNGFERFTKELERAVLNNYYLVILIEEKYANLAGFKYLPHTKFSKASPDFILKRMRDTCIAFPLNCQILCVDGRKEASRIIEKIYKLENSVKNIDLDFFYSKSQL